VCPAVRFPDQVAPARLPGVAWLLHGPHHLWMDAGRREDRLGRDQPTAAQLLGCRTPVLAGQSPVDLPPVQGAAALEQGQQAFLPGSRGRFLFRLGINCLVADISQQAVRPIRLTQLDSGARVVSARNSASATAAVRATSGRPGPGRRGLRMPLGYFPQHHRARCCPKEPPPGVRPALKRTGGDGNGNAGYLRHIHGHIQVDRLYLRFWL
jgi:hypothetical protein